MPTINAQAGRRGQRSPTFADASVIWPGVINPFHFSALLPGETLRDIYVDGRCLLRGAQSVLCGWYFDVALFRVNLLDLDPNYDEQFYGPRGAPVNSSTDDIFYGVGAGVEKYCQLAYYKVIEEFMQNEGEVLEFSAVAGRRCMPRRLKTVSSSLTEGGIEGEDILESQLADEHQDDLVENVDTMREVLKAYGVPDRRVKMASGVPELVMWESSFQYPTYVPPDDASESLQAREVLWNIREARNTTKGLYVDQPGFLIGLTCVRPEVFEGNNPYFYANELMGKDRWFVPPFDALDASQEVLQSPFGTGWTAPATTLYRNAMDYWVHGESRAVASGLTEIGSHTANIPAHAGASAPFYEDDVFSDWTGAVYGTSVPTRMPNVLGAGWACSTALRVSYDARTHIIAP